MAETTTPTREDLGRYMVVELQPRPPGRKTDRWHILNSSGGGFLAVIEWYSPWRRYALGSVAFSAVFSDDCIDDISRFLKRVNAEHRKGRK